MTSWVVETLLTTALLALVVSLLCALMPRRPALCHALWLVVLLRFLMPPVVAWTDVREFLASSETATAPEAVHVAAEASQPSTLFMAPAAFAHTLDAQTASAPYRMWLLRGLGVCWATGAGVIILLQLFGLVRRLRHIQGCTEAPEELRQQLIAAAGRVGVKPPHLRMTSDAQTAFTLHLVRRWLVLPNQLTEKLDAPALHALLIHELAHFKRRDHLWAWPEMAALALWWWCPVLWWARQRLHIYRETACDAWVVEAQPEARRTYADTLVLTVELLTHQRMPAPVLGSGAGGAAAFERRLTMVMLESVKPRAPRAGVFMTGLLALLLMPVWLTAETAASDLAQAFPPPTEALKEMLLTPVNVEFENIHLQEICSFLSESWDVNILIDYRVVEPQAESAPGAFPAVIPDVTDPPRTPGMIHRLDLSDVQLDTALKAMLRSLDLVHVPTGNYIWITNEDMVAQDLAARMNAPAHGLATLGNAKESLRATLESPVNAEFENIHLEEVIAFMADAWGINSVTDSRAILPQRLEAGAASAPGPQTVTDGLLPSVNLKYVTASEGLEAMLRTLNLTFVVEDEYVWITSFPLLKQPTTPPAP
jgi:beta-lactamase regulating signal transducer with metallopeptidase domain